VEEGQHLLRRQLGLISSRDSREDRCDSPMPWGSFASERAVLLVALGVCSPLTMVDVEDERLNVLASGARCVSLSSVHG
jgi:hypothetical protein